MKAFTTNAEKRAEAAETKAKLTLEELERLRSHIEELNRKMAITKMESEKNEAKTKEAETKAKEFSNSAEVQRTKASSFEGRTRDLEVLKTSLEARCK